jgi:hypothetical protein
MYINILTFHNPNIILKNQASFSPLDSKAFTVLNMWDESQESDAMQNGNKLHLAYIYSWIVFIGAHSR